MSLYKEGMSLDKQQIKLIIIALIALAGIWLVYHAANDIVRTKPLDVSFQHNPLKLSEREFTTLKVTLANVTGEKASNVEVTAQPIAIGNLLVDAKTQSTKEIDVIGNGEKREIEFVIRANPGKEVLPGEYQFKVMTTVNNQAFEKEITLTVQG